MTPPKSPTIKVLGLYAPMENRPAYEKFLVEYLKIGDPRYMSEDSIALFKRWGRSVEPATPEQLKEATFYLERALQGAVYVEALVSHPDDRFTPDDFVQPDPEAPHLSQCGWNETYLTADGETPIAGFPKPDIPQQDCYRVVFVIHAWRPDLPLESSYGPLACPQVQPMPDRLWRLVPYEPVD